MKRKQKQVKAGAGRILVDYKGSGEPGGLFRDDSMILSLVKEGSLPPEVSAVINFPVIDGKKVFFVHDITTGAGKKAKGFLLALAVEAAGRLGYHEVYINSGRFEEKFLKQHGFEMLPGKILARKVLEG